MKSVLFAAAAGLLSASLTSALCFIPTTGLSAGEACGGTTGASSGSTGCSGLDLYVCNVDVWQLSAVCGNSCYCEGGSSGTAYCT